MNAPSHKQCTSLKTPFSDADILSLSIGQEVLISGILCTARDRAHHYLIHETTPEQCSINLSGGIIYHCGPVVAHDTASYRIISAGPTTSGRMNGLTPALIEQYGIKGIIGKGGMDNKVAKALQTYKAVYFSAVGGAAALYAACMTQIVRVEKLEEFGMAEALWVCEVINFPVIVTMDAYGNNLHEDIASQSKPSFCP